MALAQTACATLQRDPVAVTAETLLVTGSVQNWPAKGLARHLQRQLRRQSAPGRVVLEGDSTQPKPYHARLEVDANALAALPDAVAGLVMPGIACCRAVATTAAHGMPPSLHMPSLA